MKFILFYSEDWQMLKRLIGICLIFVLLTGSLFARADGMQMTQKEYFDSKDTLSYMAHVPGRGPMRYYAQNDPLYEQVRYEHRNATGHRRFGWGGCVPTSLAIAIANMLPAERLPELGENTFEDNGFRFCTCTCSPFHCFRDHEQYRLTTSEEYSRYLPLVMAAYACGNGPLGTIHRHTQGTGTGLFKDVCNAYGLPYLKDATFQDAIEGIDRGGICIVSTGTSYTPFSKGGHYMVLAGYDEGYLYILDPNIRKTYQPMDRRNLIEILDTGLLKVDCSDLHKLYLSSYFVIYPPDAPAE